MIDWLTLAVIQSTVPPFHLYQSIDDRCLFHSTLTRALVARLLSCRDRDINVPIVSTNPTKPNKRRPFTADARYTLQGL